MLRVEKHETMKAWIWLVLAVLTGTSPARAVSDSDLTSALSQRFNGDRTGACVAAGMIDNGTISTAYVCADPKSARPYDEHTAFEIGSVTKTMTAALLAELIEKHDIALEDPISNLLPRGTSVPSYNGHDITVGQIVTHTSGIPANLPDYHPPDPSNPYAGATERDLLDTLAAIKLTREPGSKWEYSNPAMIVLSYALAKRAGNDYETLLRERLLGPLGMNETYVTKRPPQVHLAQGHYPNGEAAIPWDFNPDMAGVGGVRATLADMLRYMEGELGTRASAITPALALTQQEVTRVDGHRMGMNWNLSVMNGHTVASHDGGTGGYTSFVAFDRDAKRAVVLVSDTSLITIGGLGQFGFHLLDTSLSAGAPRTVVTADAKLIDALVGKYRMQGGLGIELRHKDSGLTIQAAGQSEFEMGYDSAGDFYPHEFDAVLRPMRKADGTYGFTWFQGGGALEAKRIDPPPEAASKWVPSDTQLQDYVGLYPLTPKLGLHVFVADGRLSVQGTNQRPLKLAPVEQDIFVAESVGAEIDFARNTGGKIVALTLKQRGQILKGERQEVGATEQKNR
jgi:CubicO group peptidase (beta-lactamase class C family)